MIFIQKIFPKNFQIPTGGLEYWTLGYGIPASGSGLAILGFWFRTPEPNRDRGWYLNPV